MVQSFQGDLGGDVDAGSGSGNIFSNKRLK